MQVAAIRRVGKRPVYDITVDEVEHYVLKNGVVTHNTGPMYSSNTVIFIGRQQEKKGTDLEGYNFILNVEKSRYVKEKSKIPLNVRFEGGVSKWSGLLDIALELGFVTKPKQGWYARVDTETGEIVDKNYRAKETETKDFWMPIITNKKFQEAVSNRYQIGYNNLIEDDEVDNFIKETE